MARRILLVLAALWLGLLAMPASAAVTITFWSHEMDESFPHAFFTLEGVPDAGGPMIDAAYGFTAKSVTPAILLGSVGGKIEHATTGYMRRSDAQFAVVLTDAQLADVQALVTEWSVNSRYNLNSRNCVHFVAEAMRRSGLTVPALPKLMKKPTSFTREVGRQNAGAVAMVGQDGKAYLAAKAARAAPAPVADTVLR